MNKDGILVSLRPPLEHRHLSSDLHYGMCAVVWDAKRAVEKVNCRKRCCFEQALSLIVLEAPQDFTASSAQAEYAARFGHAARLRALPAPATAWQAQSGQTVRDGTGGALAAPYAAPSGAPPTGLGRMPDAEAREDPWNSNAVRLETTYGEDCDSASITCHERYEVLVREEMLERRTKLKGTVI